VIAQVAKDADLANPANTRPPIVQFAFASDLADLASVFFSVGGVKSAIRTVAINRNSPSGSTLRDDGFAPIALAPHHFSVRNVFNFVLYTGLWRRGQTVAPVTIVTAKEMIKDCKLHQVNCHFFVSPLHADALFAAYYLGLWPQLEELSALSLSSPRLTISAAITTSSTSASGPSCIGPKRFTLLFA